MDEWVIWLIAACALGAGEIVTTSFFLGPFGIGALVAMVLSLAGLGSVVALVAFLAVSVVVLATLRPVARRHLTAPPAIRTGTDALIGARAVVLEAVSEDAGSIRLGGEIWTARPYDEDEVLEPGRRVQVMEIRGATALVTEA